MSNLIFVLNKDEVFWINIDACWISLSFTLPLFTASQNLFSVSPLFPQALIVPIGSRNLGAKLESASMTGCAVSNHLYLILFCSTFQWKTLQRGKIWSYFQSKYVQFWKIMEPNHTYEQNWTISLAVIATAK